MFNTGAISQCIMSHTAVSNKHTIHIYLKFTTGDVNFQIHTVRMNTFYCLKMTLKGSKHDEIMHNFRAYLIFIETVHLIMNNLLGRRIETLVQCRYIY